MNNQYLALPGPTPVCPEALRQMSTEMFNHRGPRFSELYTKVVDNCRTLYQTENDLFILTGSGTGAMEAAVVNTLSAGDPVLALINGAFGQRFSEIAQRFGADVTEYHGPWGKPFDLDQIEQLMDSGQFAAILAVHCETSTAVLNPIEQLASLRDRLQPDALLLVDAISSLGAAELPVDKWGLDVVVTGSQKVLAAPPGLAMISFNHRAWEAYDESKMPKYYWDLGSYRRFSDIGQTPYTPAISQFLALEIASKRFVQEGLENTIARHRRVAGLIRQGVQKLGLQLFCSDEAAATTVTAVLAPDGINLKKFIGDLREKHGLIVAGGQGELAGKIFRIGHLGLIDDATASLYLNLLSTGLSDQG